MGKISVDDVLKKKIFFFFQKIGFDFSCKLHPLVKNRNLINLSPAELDQRVVKVKLTWLHFCYISVYNVVNFTRNHTTNIMTSPTKKAMYVLIITF